MSPCNGHSGVQKYHFLLIKVFILQTYKYQWTLSPFMGGCIAIGTIVRIRKSHFLTFNCQLKAFLFPPFFKDSISSEEYFDKVLNSVLSPDWSIFLNPLLLLADSSNVQCSWDFVPDSDPYAGSLLHLLSHFQTQIWSSVRRGWLTRKGI